MVVVRPVLRQRLGEVASEELVDMFADANALSTASFERRLSEEIGQTRVEMAKGFADLRVDLLKWSFLFWLGQVAALTAILSVLLQRTI
jgi:hypothetical protein